MSELRLGGRCMRHPLNILPCEKCAAEPSQKVVRVLTVDQVRAMLHAKVLELGNPRNGHGGQRPLAARLGVSQTFLSDVLNGKREPTGPILESLGLERVVTYRTKESP
jgi:hypothetical protein